MKDEYRIITFGLTEEENELVAANVPTKNYEVFDTDAPTDVIAIGSEAMIIYAPAMDQDSIDSIFELYTKLTDVPTKRSSGLANRSLQRICKRYLSATRALVQYEII